MRSRSSSTARVTRVKIAFAMWFISLIIVSCIPMKPTRGSQVEKTAAEASANESADLERLFAERYFGTGMHFGSKDAQKGRQAYKVPRRAGRAEILGVYLVKAEKPCHLVEVVISGASEGFDVGDFTQAIEDRSVSFWQVPWMEVLLNRDGTAVMATADRIRREPGLLRGDVRLVFFFHYLDERSALLSPFGDLSIPALTKRPARLKKLKYEVPD